MGWIKEFGSEYDIPKAVLKLLDDGITKDMSWHNDLAPSFGIYLEKKDRDGDPKHDLDLRLFVEHPDASQREERGSDRYTVTIAENGELSSEDYTTSDVHDAIRQYKLALTNFLTPTNFFNTIAKWSKDKLNDWYEANVGYRPSKDHPPITADEIRHLVAGALWLQYGGSEAALDPKKGF